MFTRFVRKPEGKRTLGWLRHRWEDFKEMRCKSVDWI
jgi:hypothetical protein